jgi:hypothetical protein
MQQVGVSPSKITNQVQGKIVTDKYTYKTYDMARFHIPDGMYSIAEIEKMLVQMKAAKKRQDENLKRSMQPLKEKNT